METSEQQEQASNGTQGTGGEASQPRFAVLQEHAQTPKEQAQNGGEQPLFRNDRVYEALRNGEFDITSGLCEIGDNSVEAGAHNLWFVTSNTRKAFRGRDVEVLDTIAIVDDGEGMSHEVLAGCLMLGNSVRPIKATGGRGIGRFGVGLILGAISLARHVEVYSRQDKSEPFYRVMLDLGLIKHNVQKKLETEEAQPPQHLAKLLDGRTGTIVVLSQCDRLQHDPAEQEKGVAASQQLKDLPSNLGRIYRKFIMDGLQIWLNNGPVYLHDPLYLEGPTRFDAVLAAKKQPPEPKAIDKGEAEIEVDIPNQAGKKAKVKIRMSLLPAEWRQKQGDGNSKFAKEHKVDDNEGVSILRADREVLYGAVPYILGRRGRAKTEAEDRFWGCEISFPPELDEYFTVRFIKRGVEPVASLRDQIRDKIAPTIESLREEIKAGWRKSAENAVKEHGVFRRAEDAMAKADRTLPRTSRKNVTPEQDDKQLEELAEEAIATTPPSSGVDLTQAKEAKKKELAQKPYSIIATAWPGNEFFVTVHGLNHTTIKLNVNHRFYKDIFEPLCGTVETMEEDAEDESPDSEDKRRARDAFMLLLLSYAKAEALLKGDDDDQSEDSVSDEMLSNLRTQWSLALGTSLRKLKEDA